MQNLEQIKKEALKSLNDVKDAKELEFLRIKYLGRKGEINKLFDYFKNLSLEEKRKHGPDLQNFKSELEKLLSQKELSFTANAFSEKYADITMPGKKLTIGHLHPLSVLEKRVREIFKAMNFSVVEGPEAESEFYNFDALNIPKSHPARDMWDTFWLEEETKTRGKMLLRTHTSPVQIRYMETHKPPFQVIVPGKVFRFEATDVSHEINFNQVEGFMVGKDISLANFKFIIQEFFKRLFNKDLKIRLRPSFFPFVEPGLEVDLECIRCSGKGCGICGESGWLEIMGAGMIHPKVFEVAGYNPREWQGFAFGLGLERIAIIKYNIPDIRLFYSGDLRFIRQF